MNALTFFRSLGPNDWPKKVTEKWTVKDVLSHLVGWDREVLSEFRNTFEKGEEPWFMKTDDYREFNDRIYEEFKNASPEELLDEMERCEKSLEYEIRTIGEDEIRQKESMSWVFDEGDKSHFGHHIEQIRSVLDK